MKIIIVKPVDPQMIAINLSLHVIQIVIHVTDKIFMIVRLVLKDGNFKTMDIALSVMQVVLPVTEKKNLIVRLVMMDINYK